MATSYLVVDMHFGVAHESAWSPFAVEAMRSGMSKYECGVIRRKPQMEIYEDKVLMYTIIPRFNDVCELYNATTDTCRLVSLEEALNCVENHENLEELDEISEYKANIFKH